MAQTGERHKSATFGTAAFEPAPAPANSAASEKEDLRATVEKIAAADGEGVGTADDRHLAAIIEFLGYDPTTAFKADEV